jgi:hypothetical protein
MVPLHVFLVGCLPAALPAAAAARLPKSALAA